ncbi:hypothetical protein EYF80_060792 [Liparis tanakae]|uniref:Uncharacterized protein n=1 Tax=Liparis tanakae TaxID=230148 RepID=A0A4Z2EJT2_9TELE|nr:hypothetical protein EYF80_060792 [Liparis tanakae]
MRRGGEHVGRLCWLARSQSTSQWVSQSGRSQSSQTNSQLLAPSAVDRHVGESHHQTSSQTWPMVEQRRPWWTVTASTVKTVDYLQPNREVVRGSTPLRFCVKTCGANISGAR